MRWLAVELGRRWLLVLGIIAFIAGSRCWVLVSWWTMMPLRSPPKIFGVNSERLVRLSRVVSPWRTAYKFIWDCEKALSMSVLYILRISLSSLIGLMWGFYRSGNSRSNSSSLSLQSWRPFTSLLSIRVALKGDAETILAFPIMFKPVACIFSPSWA